MRLSKTIFILLFFCSVAFSQYMGNGGNYTVKTVKQDSTGDYVTITEALAGITDATVNKQYKLIINEGTYNEVHIQLKNYIHLYGTNPNTCIINGSYADDGDTVLMKANSTLEWSSILCDIKYLTIRMTNGHYCIHDDGNFTGTKTLELCILQHLGNDGVNTLLGYRLTTYPYCYGAGMGTGNHIVWIKNCTMTSKEVALFIHTGSGEANSTYNIYGCNITNTYYVSPAVTNASIYIGYYALYGDIFNFTNTITNNKFYIYNSVTPIVGFINFSNVTYDTLVCGGGGCF